MPGQPRLPWTNTLDPNQVLKSSVLSHSESLEFDRLYRSKCCRPTKCQRRALEKVKDFIWFFVVCNLRQKNNIIIIREADHTYCMSHQFYTGVVPYTRLFDLRKPTRHARILFLCPDFSFFWSHGRQLSCSSGVCPVQQKMLRLD